MEAKEKIGGESSYDKVVQEHHYRAERGVCLANIDCNPLAKGVRLGMRTCIVVGHLGSFTTISL